MRLNTAVRNFEPHPFSPLQFHVLLNSLFKVLFTFPSPNLCAIGLVVIFSLRWILQPASVCVLKQTDSQETPTRSRRRQYGPGTLYGLWHRSRETCARRARPGIRTLPNATFPAGPTDRGIQRWALPCSLAATDGILVSFFSSP